MIAKECEKYKIVLASASPRRKELMELAGFDFEIWPSDKDEVITEKVPERVCTQLSKMKALDVASQIRTYNANHPDITTEQDILVIGADTIVAIGNTILGKPVDEEEAKSMLGSLSGNTHSVFTGVTFVFMSRDGRVGEYTFSDETKVMFYELSEAEIAEYVATGDPLDKAGAYGIQTKSAMFVKGIEGDFYNVMGLPIAKLVHELNNLFV